MPLQKAVPSELLGEVVNKFNNNTDLQFINATYDAGNLILDLYNGSTIIVPLPIPVVGGQILSTIGSLSLGSTNGSYNILTITPITYLYNGETFSINTNTILSLSNGDSTNDRIDAIYIDSADNTIKKIDGIPANPPLLPNLTDTQILIGAVYVKANGTSHTPNFYNIVFTGFTSQQQIINIENGHPITKLVDLTDVNITTPIDSYGIVYDSTSSKFVLRQFPNQVEQNTSGSGLMQIGEVIHLGGNISRETNLNLNDFDLNISNGSIGLVNFLLSSLNDNNGNISINYQNRFLYDDSNMVSVDYEARQLKGSNGNTVIDFNTYTYYDANQILSINQNARNLYSTTGEVLINYTSNQIGLTYAKDYGSNFIARSLVDRAYVDSILMSAEPVNNGLQYINGTIGLGGQLIYNTQIIDINGKSIIDFTNRNLNDSSGNNSIDWQGRATYDISGTESMQWDTRILKNSSYNTILDWENSLLLYNNNICIDWQNRVAYDSSNNNSLDWQNRTLLDSNNNNSLDWFNRSLNGTNGISIANWYSAKSGIQYQLDYSNNYTDRSLVDKNYVNILINNINITGTNGLFNSGRTIGLGGTLSRNTSILLNNKDFKIKRGSNNVIDLANEKLYDSSGNVSIDWNNRYLYDVSSNITIYYGARILSDSSSHQSIDWNNRYCVDSSNNHSIDWQNRQLKNSIGITVLDWNTPIISGIHYTGTNGIVVSGSTIGLPLSGVTASSYNFITVNNKGLVTAGSNKPYLTGNQTITLTGDVTGSGSSGLTTTLATVNSNIGTFNSVTVNAKGLVTAASNIASTIPLTQGTNGLFNSGRTIGLGGTLSRNTSILLNNKDFKIMRGATKSVDFGNTMLYTSAGLTSIDYGGKILYDNSGATSIHFLNRTLNDVSGNASLSFANRVLLSASNITNYNWNTNLIFSGSGTSGNFNTRVLYGKNQKARYNYDTNLIFSGSGTSGNFNTRVLYANDQRIAIDFNNRRLIDFGTAVALDWTTRALNNFSNRTTINWNNNTHLYAQSTASGTSGNFNVGLLYAKGTKKSIDFNNRELFDSNINQSINYDIRNLISSNGSTIYAQWQNSTSGNSILTNNLLSSKIIHGDKTLSASSTTTITVTIGQTLTNTNYYVGITPGNLLSAAPLYVNNQTTTSFDVVYASSILTGTIDFRWVINN